MTSGKTLDWRSRLRSWTAVMLFLACYLPAIASAGAEDPETIADCDEDEGACPNVCAQFPVTGQTRTIDAGEDGNPAYGAPFRFVDNGDGTITDENTGLMWEKLSDDDSIHDKDNVHTWTTALFRARALNERCADDESESCATDADCAAAGAGGPCGFAGYQDWRLPNAKELQSIVDYGAANPAIAAAFDVECAPACTILACSCTAFGGFSTYLTSTNAENNPVLVWVVSFGDGRLAFTNVENFSMSRAVRGGEVAQP